LVFSCPKRREAQGDGGGREWRARGSPASVQFRSISPGNATSSDRHPEREALFVITQTADTTVLFVACAIYGFSIGNLITLPPLIIYREFEPAVFSTVLGLSTAVGGIISALGPGLVGFVRGATGGYAAALMLCLTLKLVSAALVLCRPRRVTG